MTVKEMEPGAFARSRLFSLVDCRDFPASEICIEKRQWHQGRCGNANI
jgi:hypothetical protein